jgi:dipeptidyl aminopeptidase/acylaminoacyl peptidase
MKRLHLSTATIILFACAALSPRPDARTTSSQQPPTPLTAQEEPGKWTVDDVVMAETASQFDISPDGRWVVWVKTVGNKEKSARVSNLMLSSLTEKKEIQLTRGMERHAQPRWSPNGQLMAFISTRPVPKEGSSTEEAPPSGDEKGPRAQLWLMNPFGGEPWALTNSERSVTSFEWVDDDTILFAAQEDPSFYERKLKEDKDTSIVVDDEPHEPPVRLFKLAVKSNQVIRLTDNDDWIQGLAVSPDGRQAVTVHNKSLHYIYDERVKPVTFLYDLKTGDRRQLFTDGKINPVEVHWSRDSKGFYVSSAYGHHPIYLMATITVMYYYDLSSGAASRVNLDWPNEIGLGYQVTSDGFIASLANGARPKLARYARQADGKTWTRAWIEGEQAAHVFGMAVSKDDKTLVYDYTTASTPPQWYRATLDGAKMTEPVQLTDLNPQLKKRLIAQTEVVRWKGAREEEVEGLLYYPHHYEPGQKYPLVVMIHGGPSGADYDSWDENWAYPQNLMNQRGAFVLKPNYHGSSDYGLAWVESIGGGNYYDLEVIDIERGVDSLIERGLVDPERLGALGWSNGSILTIALTTTTTRYKVASAGAGDVDWASDWGNCMFGAAFDNYYLGASPLENPELYIKKSPFFRMKNVKTPTIIFFGTEDKNVPTQQGWMHYRALQQLGQTEVRFMLFPGEPHSLRKLAHQHRKLEEELAWFDKYLFKTAEQSNEAVKPDSPLAVAVKLKSVKKAGQRYGVLETGVLIPEMVKYGKLELGRFEVTRAQYAAFDKTYVVAPGQENYPANGISFEQAKAYCEWLSRLTGQAYRLGTEADMKPVYEAAKVDENTLDYWAGYKVNPDDAERLSNELKKLDGLAPLLKPVGSFKPVSRDDLVFDLGGNVAEWIIGDDGKGRLMGGSADTPADSKRRQRAAAPEYTGFRVVKGAAKEMKE